MTEKVFSASASLEEIEHWIALQEAKEKRESSRPVETYVDDQGGTITKFLDRDKSRENKKGKGKTGRNSKTFRGKRSGGKTGKGLDSGARGRIQAPIGKKETRKDDFALLTQSGLNGGCSENIHKPGLIVWLKQVEGESMEYSRRKFYRFCRRDGVSVEPVQWFQHDSEERPESADVFLVIGGVDDLAELANNRWIGRIELPLSASVGETAKGSGADKVKTSGSKSKGRMKPLDPSRPYNPAEYGQKGGEIIYIAQE